MRFVPSFAAASLSIQLIAPTTVAHAQPVSFRTIAISGQPAPSLPNLTLATVSDPRVTDYGRVAFWSRLEGPGTTEANDGVIVSARSGVQNITIREGDPVPDTGSTLSGISTLAFHESGLIAFVGAVAGTLASDPTNVGVFVETAPGVLSLAARDAFFMFRLPGVVAINTGGFIAWAESPVIQNFGTPLPPSTLVVHPGGVRYDHATHAPGPNLPPSSLLRFYSAPSINNSGRIAFRCEAGVQTPEPGGTWTHGIFTDRSGELSQVVIVGGPALITGQTWRELDANPTITDDHSIIFWARVQGSGIMDLNDTGLYRSVGDSIEPLVTEDQPIPSVPGATFATFHRRIAAAANGRVIFLAHLRGVQAGNSAIFSVIPGQQPNMLAREDDPAPGAGPDVLLGVLGEPRINPSGRIAFTASLKGFAVTPLTSHALFATTRTSQLVLVARTGQTFAIPGGPTRTIRSIVFDTDPEGGFSQYTSGGMLVYKLTFTDNTMGIFAANIDCLADLDDGSDTGTPDGGVTIDDLIFFLARFDSGDADADIDDGSFTGTRDGGVTVDDLLYYLLRYESGC